MTDITRPQLIVRVAPERAWVVQAKCRGRTNVFFGPPHERPEARLRREAVARKYCEVCPVSEPCRQWAREHGENGLWGGENEEERAAAGYAPRSITRRSVAAARDDQLPDTWAS